LADSSTSAPAAIDVEEFSLWYGDFQALHGVGLQVKKGRITSLIGPSGCGKSTLLRSVNRIVDRLGYVRTSGRISVLGHDVHGAGVELSQLRRQVGMVFQRPNPLPLSIRENILFAHKLHNPGARTMSKGDAEQLVRESLEQVLLWDQVRDRLRASALGLSLEEQQKLCIARLLPVKPKVLLMDEPCSALDAEATAVVEELIWKLREDYTILLVTHNMAQARRASDDCAFMLMGEVVEHGETGRLFVSPTDPRTADYIEGRYG